MVDASASAVDARGAPAGGRVAPAPAEARGTAQGWLYNGQAPASRSRERLTSKRHGHTVGDKCDEGQHAPLYFETVDRRAARRRTMSEEPRSHFLTSHIQPVSVPYTPAIAPVMLLTV
jgi:hypothetical protein